MKYFIGGFIGIMLVASVALFTFAAALALAARRRFEASKVAGE